MSDDTKKAAVALNTALTEATPEVISLQAQLRALESNVILDRFRFMRQAGMTFGGARDEYEILGYDRNITNRQYREEYMRGGIAGRLVDVYPNATWRGSMELIEDEDPDKNTPFEQAWKDLDQRLQIQAKLLRVDKLAGLSTYAVLLIGASGEFDTELPKAKKPEDLLYLTPFGGGGGPMGAGPGGSGESRASAMDADATIFEFDTDTQSPRFGLPLTYRIRRTDISSPSMAKPVHWTRIIHVAENLLDDEVYGQPALERVWNLLCDLRKITGGGAEAFWLRANQGLHLNVDKDMALPKLKDTLEELKGQAEAYKHQLDRWLRTRGVDVEVLGSDVANFENPADAVLTQIAGSKGIPKRILTGSEMGELASSQDRDNWKDQINGRQTGYAGPYLVRPLVDRLIEYGYLPTPAEGPRAYEVRWPHMQTLTEQEKVDGAKGWATVNSTQGNVIFTDEEIRDKWAGLAPLTDEQKAEVEAQEQKKQEAAQAMKAPAEGAAPSAATPKKKEPAAKEEKEVPKKEAAPKKKPNPFLKAAGEYKYSSTQVQIPEVIAKKLLAFGEAIPDESLAEDGREDEPHVTVKWGLTTNAASDVREALAEVEGPVRLTLGRLAFFSGEDHDVVYVEIDSPDLERLNKKISSTLDAEDSHDKYIPHATLAYVKKGLGATYEGDDRFEGLEASIGEVEFRPASGEDETIALGLRAAEYEPDEELVRVLAEAIEAGAVDVIEAICGVKTLGGPGSGNFGHSGRPGEVGGSGGGGGYDGGTDADAARRKEAAETDARRVKLKGLEDEE